MRTPAWLRRWALTRRRYERLVDNADQTAITAIKEARALRTECGTLRAQLRVAEQARDDARARAAAAEAAATEHARGRKAAEEQLRHLRDGGDL